MSTKKILKFLTLAVGMAVCGFAGTAKGGDIFEIGPCDEKGTPITTTGGIATSENPITATGTNLYFKVRLMARNLGKCWYVEYTGSGSEIVADAMYPLQIGIYVSGLPTVATLVAETQDEENHITDLVFKYTVKPGDFALPIVLATNANRPAVDGDSASAYVLDRLDKWTLKNGETSTDVCEMSYAATSSYTLALPTDYEKPRRVDYSLSNCGFYVKTVDFDPEWEVAKGEPGECWRSVHENSTITVGNTPRLVATTLLEELTTLYVWSDNEDAVQIKGGTATEIITNYSSGIPQTAVYHVGKVTINGGQLSKDFQIEGKGEGGTANLILSAWPEFRYDGGRKPIEDYVTVPVKCVEPLPASVIVECDKQTMIADGDYLISAARLSVYLTQPYEDGEVAVTVTPKFEDDAAKDDWQSYVRFSTTSDSLSTLPPADSTPPVVKIPANSTEKKSIWVYALRADTHTVGDGHQVQFVPTIDETAIDIHQFQAAGAWISADKPHIVTPDETSEYSVTCGDDLEIHVAVDDTYADMTDTATGYKVQIKTGSTASWQTLPEYFKASGEGGELVGLTSGNPPIVNYPISGDQTSIVKVTSPISGKTSDEVKFTVHVSAARTTSAETTDEGKDNRYDEGDLVSFKISLSDANDTGAPIYAFLLCNEDVDITMFEAGSCIITNAAVAQPGSTGCMIGSYGTTVEGSFQVLDGMNRSSGGVNYTFSVVLCASRTWDPAKRISGYPTTEGLSFRVYNVEPRFYSVYLNGFETENGQSFNSQLPKGQIQTIQPEIDDVSYDLDNGFTYKWTAYRNGQAKANGEVKNEPGVNINETPFTYDFPQAGEWTIKIQIKDKDMNRWSETEIWEFYVTVLDSPTVNITTEDRYLETDTAGKRPAIAVGLSYYDSDAPIVVRLTVTDPAGENPGILRFAEELKTPPAGYEGQPTGDNIYYLSFTTAGDQDVLIEEMDGTIASSSKGFAVRAEVVTTTTSTDPTKTWDQYYLAANEKVYVENADPICTVTPNPEGMTNRIAYASGYKIVWNVRSDVDADFTTGGLSTWPTAGVKLTFSGCENPADECIIYADKAGTSGTFIPNFGTAQGDVDLVLSVEDKDGSYQLFTWQFTIKPSKYLTTVSTGPSGGSAGSAISQRYSRASGFGAGHTYANGATFTGGDNFRLRWNCGTKGSVDIYGFGYKFASPVDNGTLDSGRDIAITPAGVGAAAAPYFDYTTWLAREGAIKEEDEKDSFLYCWILQGSGENGATADAILGGTFAIEHPGVIATGTVSLPTEQTGDGNYADATVEAIFSREWLKTDNLGDMNQDGVPDYYAFKDDWANGKLIELVHGMDDLSGDLLSLADSNPDEDYLPGVVNIEDMGSLVEGANNSYAPIGPAFITQMELRGFADGLNDPDGKVTHSDADFNDTELAAWKAYAEANGLGEDAPPDLAVWSPEPGFYAGGKVKHMDPTTDDTDVDNLPDGWEYYFWYQAHVELPAGKAKPRNGQVYVFEKFNLNNIIEGIEIPAAEVEEYFNPLIQRTKEQNKNRPDFDGDGLADIEELLIGTNPCHWDTDGDRMCDGWEVMMCLDPLGGSKSGNQDGDFYAQFSTVDYWAWQNPANNNAAGEGLNALQPVHPGNEYAIELAGQYLGVNGLGVYWDYNTFAEYNADGKLIALPTAVVLRDFTAEVFWFKAMSDPHDPTGETPYCYGKVDDMPEDPLENPDTKWGYFMSNEYGSRVQEFHAGDILVQPLFVFIHDQVRDIFGFDPRTGWFKNAAGYVGDRWNPAVNENLNPVDASGVAVNTAAYLNYDEYLVMRWRIDFAKNYPIPPAGKAPVVDPKNPWATMRTFTTNPSVPKTIAEQTVDVVSYEVDPVTGATNEVHTAETTEVEVETSASAISKAIAQAFIEAGSDKAPVTTHGADTDGDGVPDGWELYVHRDPCNAFGAEENPIGMCIGKSLDGDLFDDGLTFVMEYAGTDSCNAYMGCESIYRNHPGNQSGWWNKFFPTNPGFHQASALAIKPAYAGSPADDCDTDDDGIPDSLEGSAWAGVFPNGANSWLFPPDDPGFTFIYGDRGDDGTDVVRGGGLNPCSSDTDLDGLPDAWEYTHAGVAVNASTKEYVGPSGVKVEVVDETFIADGVFTGGPDVVYIAGGQDGTWRGDGWTDPVEDGNSSDSLLETVRDVDFDHDGLQNYQEYLVQQLRHLRYDDITTPLMGRLFKEGPRNLAGYLIGPHTQSFMGFIPMMQDAADFCNTAAIKWYGAGAVTVSTTTNDMVVTVNPATGYTVTNYITSVTTNVADGAAEVVRNYMKGVGSMFEYSWSAAGWDALGYMTSATHPWDRTMVCYGGMMIVPFMRGIDGATGYVSTDPRVSDSDGDGMDDYYEVFHGLNPILGSSTPGENDLISGVLAPFPELYNAFWNEWTDPNFDRMLALQGEPGSEMPALSAPAAFDPVLYPWTMGVPEADADGDGVRNFEEAALANVASPTAMHTDPTPIWFTDSSSSKSFVQQYYPLSYPTTTLPFWPNVIGWENPYSVPAAEGGVLQYTYAFEENEGYDTDGDWVPDGREIVKTTRSTSDPLKFTDPNRRQAAWFDGVNSYMMTKELQYRGVDAVDLLKQFTVECWVRPEELGREQTILERATYYQGDAITTLGGVIRANFRLSLSAAGEIVGMFDNSDSIESGTQQPTSCQTVSGTVLPLGKWTHVALTYDGHELVLFENGRVVSRAATSLIPANGVIWIGQNPVGAMPSSTYKFVPVAFFVGARPVHFEGAAMTGYRPIPLYPYYVDSTGMHYESFDNYREYFKGWVDEVRVWDGARSVSDILANYNKALTFDDVAANRESVYENWLMGATRNDNDGLPTLPPELVQHYSFTALPGALDGADVAQVPVGFDKNVDAAAQNGYNQEVVDNPDNAGPYWDVTGLKGVPGSTELVGGINVAWWDACLTRSQVYSDTRVLPWVQNTVAHLPVMDGSCVDTMLYSDLLGGSYTPASTFGLTKFTFPNTAMPYQYQVYFLERYNHLFCLDILTNQLGAAYAPINTRYQFEIRGHFIGTSDLLPMGGAFAKTCPELWDGSASDAWEYSRTDLDADGLPDWWEEYARDNYCSNLDSGDELNWDTVVTYNGVTMNAYQAYLIDLALGMQPNGEYKEELVSTVDEDNDSLPDWWENMFGVAEYGPNDDPDHDGLSNYAEWKIAFGPGFGVQNGWPFLNPTLSHTDPHQEVTDYFLKPLVADPEFSTRYIGELVTDHDFMEDEEETVIGTDRTKYDPYSDNDEDGWTAWSELRYTKFKTTFIESLVSHVFGETELLDSPTPVVHATLRYNGGKVDVGSTTPIVIAAYTGNNLQMSPDAKFTVTPGTPYEKECFLGSCADAHVVHGTLAPGYVQAGLDNIVIQFSFIQPDDDFTWSNAQNEDGEWIIKTGKWAEMYADYQTSLIADGPFKLMTQEMAWKDLMDPEGEHNALQVSVDQATQKGHLMFMYKRVGEIDLLTGDFDFDTTELQRWVFKDSGVGLRQCVACIRYKSIVPTFQTKALSVSLVAPDAGKLKEGSTTFVAFFDLDGNGELDPVNEPVGLVRNVAVGWDRVNDVTIEMLDKPACGYRFTYGEDVTKVRIIRNAINGDTNGVARTIVFNRAAADAASRNVWDGDYTTVGRFGLDWAGLRGDLDADPERSYKDVTSIGYIVVVGDDKLSEIPDEAIVDSFTINYVADAAQSLPVCCSPSPKADAIVTATRPTFVWDAIEGFTAFRLQIADSEGAIVYSSDIAALPARDSAKRYVWQAPVYVGLNDTDDGWSLANNTNYSWRVAMYNPKFSLTNDEASVWSDWTAFRTAAAEKNDFSTAYGTAKVDVRYFGPATNPLGDVLVALYRNADFSGVPAAKARLVDTGDTVSSLTNGQVVTFIGLESGEYYAAAFIDRNGNGGRDRYESWGYYNQIGCGLKDVFTPLGVKVDANGSAVPLVQVFIEDTDLNRNGVLDMFDDESLLKEADRVMPAGGGNSEAGGSGTGGTTASDADGDGLDANDESNAGTDASKLDTDDDGMPDGWESIFAGTVAVNPDSDFVVDGDVMAYAETNCTVVTDKSGKSYVLKAGTVARVGDEIDPENLITTYDYPTLVGSGDHATVVTYLGLGTNLVAGTDKILVDGKRDTTVVLVHAQVYDAFGFNNKTASPSDGAPNTKPFTALDKYLVARYLQAIGFTDVDETEMNRNRGWAACTLKPRDADNDRDGMGDGWELYVMFGTNTTGFAAGKTLADAPISPWNFADRESTFDGDSLTAVDEYAEGKDPSDPWNEHSVWESLVRDEIIGPDIAPFTDEVRRFGIGESELDLDWDGDLVSNGDEMRAYYRDFANGSTLLADIDPRNPVSDGVTPDYFRAFVPAAGELSYLGCFSNGGEFIEPAVRKLVVQPGASRAGTRPFQNIGWDIWSTARYSIENAEKTQNIEGVVSDELMLLIRYWNVIRPGEFTGTTVGEAMDFFHTVWEGIIRLLDAQGNVLIETKDGNVAGNGTIHDADAAQTTTDVLAFFGGQKKVEEVIALNKKDLTADEIVTPEAMVNLVLRYAGNASYNLVLESYQINPAYAEYGLQMTAQWTVPVRFDAGVAVINEIRTPGLGSLKQGPARFVAYIDQDGDGKLSPADTMGWTVTTVGYKGCDISIRLGDSNPALPIIDLTEPEEAQAEGEEAAPLEGVTDEEPVYQTVAIVRTKVNGQYLTSPRGVSLLKYDNNVNRTVVSPAEFVEEDFIGLDRYLANGDYSDDALAEVEEVTYEIVKIRRTLVDEGPEISVTNLNHYTITIVDEEGKPVVDEDGKTQKQVVDQDINETFTVKYSITRDVPLDVSGNADSKTDDTVVAFSIPTDRAVTKFWLELDGSVCESPDGRGFLLLGAADGRMILDQRWFVENNLADLLTAGVHEIRVGLGNDKFPDEPGSEEEWSAVATFGIAEEAAFDGAITVQVQHPYVDNAEFAGRITVAAYDKADLAAQAKVVVGANAGEAIRIDGLRKGADYYLAAWFVKDEEDGRVSAADRLPYDTWGYVTSIGISENDFDALAVKATEFAVTTNMIYLQDTDWNDNGIADREEELLSVAGITPSSAPIGEEFELRSITSKGEEAEEEDPDPDGDDVPAEEDEDPVFDNGDQWIERDVMAYYQTRGYFVYIACTNTVPGSKKKVTGAWYWLSDYPAEQERLSPNECPVRNGENAANLTSLMSTYVYTSKKNNTIYGVGTNVTFAADAGYAVINDGESVGYGWNNLVFVHAQVYSLFGFNSATANGYIPRGEWVNTKAFTQADKTTYVQNYLLAIGAITNKKDVATLSVKKLDNDADGVLDGWELYTMFGDDPKLANTPAYCLVANAPHSPWNIADRAFDADKDGLTLYQEYDGGYHPTNPFDGDTNRDGITDALAFKYHIKDSGMLDDQDGDGLNNYVEYLLSEVFDLGVKFDPDNAYSVNTNELDYFFKIGNVYVGEFFTDFDMIEDTWEDAVGVKYANRYRWDALADEDGDGWSNFDECRYADFAEPYPVVTSNGTKVVTNFVRVAGVAQQPRPSIRLTVTYGDDQVVSGGTAEAGATLGGTDEEGTSAGYAPIVLMTYTRDGLVVPDATFSAVPQGSLLAGPQTLELTDPLTGNVKGGENTFVAFCDLDGNGLYTAGEPMGVATGVAVGWAGVEATIELTDVSPIITRADLLTGESDRGVLYGSDSGDMEPLYVGDLSGGKYQHIRVIRTMVDGIPCSSLGMLDETCVVLDKWIELDQRSFFYEGDVLANGEFDLDWNNLSTVRGLTAVSSRSLAVTNVCYRIVLGNGDASSGSTNNLFSIATVHHFDVNHVKPAGIAPGDENAVVYGSRPTFKWTTYGRNTYTAFRIRVSGNGLSWNSGLIRTPACSPDGVYSYTPDLYLGDQLENNKNYQWSVSMYNAKFRDDVYSDPLTFRMNAPTDGGFYGEIPVCVKYYGPATARAVYVEAFEKPDFSGSPVARATTSLNEAITKYGDAHEANVTLQGLTKGQYYIRAFLDHSAGTTAKLDDWESRGYLCGRERDLKTPFKPIPVILTDAAARAELATVYIEDADVNGNKIPDAWEMSKYGSLDTGASHVDRSTAGGAALNSELSAKLVMSSSDGATGGLVPTLPVSTGFLSQTDVMMLAMGIDTDPVIVDGAIVVEPEVKSLVITSIRLDAVTGEIVLGVAGETSGDLGAAGSIYNIEVKSGAPVTAKVYRTDTLAGEWKLVAEKEIVIGGSGTELRTAVEGIDTTSGFYRVEIVK